MTQVTKDEEPKKRTMDYLTSLRGLAAIFVVFYHARHYMQLAAEHPLMIVFAQGFLAVDFFFMLSGFIIAYNYSRDFTSITWSGYGRFMWKRFARIYPLHLFVLLLFALFPLVLYVTGREPDNVLYLPEAFPYKVFLVDAWWTGHALTWNVPSWSISAELFAYIMFPLLLRPFIGLRLSLVVLVAVLLLASLGAVWEFNRFDSIGDGIPNFGVLRCVIEFAVGIAVYFIASDARVERSGSGRLLVVLALMSVFLGGAGGVANFWYMPLAFMLFLTGILTWHGSLHRLLERRSLVYLGDISYSVYLTHFFVLDFMGKAFLRNDEKAGVFWVLACVVVTLVLSSVTFRFVEASSRRYLIARASGVSLPTRS